MAVSAVMGAISTVTTSIGGGTLMGGFLVAGAGTMLTHFLVSTAMGAALNALTPKARVSGGAGGYSINGASGSALDHQIVYGETKVGSIRIYDESTGSNNNVLHRVLAFAGHEIQSFQQIYLNDEVVTLDGTGNVTSPARYNGKVMIKQHLGSPTQAADADLAAVSPYWTTSHNLYGIAYLYVRFTYNTDAFPNGIPVVSAVIRGKKVFDPRTSTTAWSKNAALCLRDYLSSGYGLNQPSTKIDDTLVIAAANVCDEVVTSEARYECSGAFLTSASPGDIASGLLTAMGGLLWYSQGKWRMRAAKWIAPTLELTVDDLRSQISVSTRHSRRENFNVVKGKFKGPVTDWQESDYPNVSSPFFVTTDGGYENFMDYDLPYTNSSNSAQRIAKIALYRNREQLTFNCNFGLKALKLQVGDVVSVTLPRFGWSLKAFEVLTWDMIITEDMDIQFSLTLRETSSNVFIDADVTVFETNNTNLPSPYATEPVGIALSSEVRMRNESIVDVIYITTSATNRSMVERVEVQFKKTTDANWTVAGVGDLEVYEVVNTENVSYDFRARSYNYMGVKGDWTYYNNYTSTGLIAPPQDVTNFRANLTGGSILLEWSPVTDLDLSHYKIRHSLEEAGATYANSTGGVAKVSRPATSVSVPARPGTYHIKAYDKLGNASLNYTSVVVPEAALEDFTNTLVSTQHATFSGVKTNCAVTTGELRLTTYTTAPAVGTYEFTTYVDTGAVRRIRCRVDVNVTRFNAASALWDSIAGLWDSFPGLWDDWTGTAQYADIDVITYISVTEQDPAGAPIWSSWQIFKAGDFYGRAFKFKVELQTESNNITPSISGLVARVQY